MIHSAASSPQLHNGFYVYKNEIYTHRELIFERMESEKDFLSPIRFYFNDKTFSQYDWTIEPSQSLPELYKARALQLREQYDYLILSYSGGSDSHEVLRTFIDNGIFLDEIQTVYYSMIDSVTPDALEKQPTLKQLLEYQYNVVPELKRLRETSPNTRITVLDASDYLVDETINRKFLQLGHGNRSPATLAPVVKIPRIMSGYQHRYNEKMIGGRKTAFISGVEKPCLRINKDGSLSFRFYNIGSNTVKYVNEKIIDNIYTVEEFFWSVDAPLIPIKQSHEIKKALESSPEFLKAFLQNQLGITLSFNFEKSLIPLIYQHWHGKMNFQKSGISPDFALIETVFGNTNGQTATSEYNDFIERKYAKMGVAYLRGAVYSRDYNIGKVSSKK